MEGEGEGPDPMGRRRGDKPVGRRGGVRTEDDVVPMAQANCTHYPSSLSPRLTKLSISPNSIAKSCSNVLGKRDSFTTSTTGFFTTLSLSSSSIPSPYGCGEGREEGREGEGEGKEGEGGRREGEGEKGRGHIHNNSMPHSFPVCFATSSPDRSS